MSATESSASHSLVAFPGLNVLDRGDTLEITNGTLGSSVRISRSVAQALTFFDRPRTAEEFFDQAMGPRAEWRTVVQRLLDAHVLVRIDELAALEGGLLHPAAQPIGVSCTLQEFAAMPKAPDAVVIGAPVDVATGARGGARHGPSEIRRNMPRFFASTGIGPRSRSRAQLVDFDFRRTYIARVPTVRDLGDIAFTPGESNDLVGIRIRRAVELALQRDTTPVLLGGDHSISWFALQAIAARYGPVGVIHFDAHADLYPPKRRIVHHGNPFVFALHAGHVRYLLQIGLRGVVPVPPDIVPTSDRRVAYVSARELQDRTAASVLRKLPRGLPYYLTFDVDCLAPHAAPETGAPVSGGLSFYQALDLIDLASRRLNFVGADFVEVSGPEQWQNTAAIATARYVTQFLLRGATFERLKGYYVAPTFPAT